MGTQWVRESAFQPNALALRTAERMLHISVSESNIIPNPHTIAELLLLHTQVSHSVNTTNKHVLTLSRSCLPSHSLMIQLITPPHHRTQHSQHGSAEGRTDAHRGARQAVFRIISGKHELCTGSQSSVNEHRGSEWLRQRRRSRW
jgi:hypothetical protein